MREGNTSGMRLVLITEDKDEVKKIFTERAGDLEGSHNKVSVSCWQEGDNEKNINTEIVYELIMDGSIDFRINKTYVGWEVLKYGVSINNHYSSSSWMFKEIEDKYLREKKGIIIGRDGKAEEGIYYEIM